MDHRQPPGFDRTRESVIGDRDVKLEYIEEAFTTTNWLVRIYKYGRLAILYLGYLLFNLALCSKYNLSSAVSR